MVYAMVPELDIPAGCQAGRYHQNGYAAVSYTHLIYLTVFKGLSQRYSAVTINKWMFIYASMCYIPFSYYDISTIDVYKRQISDRNTEL